MAERPCVPRVAWVDVTKGLAMLFVMSNHCGFPYGPLCYFVVPAFFILAGVMLKPVEDFSRFALLKVRRLMVPYVVWNLLFMVIVLPGYFFSDGLLLSLRRIAVGLAESVNYPLWFLKALLWAFLIVGLLVSRRAFFRNYAGKPCPERDGGRRPLYREYMVGEMDFGNGSSARGDSGLPPCRGLHVPGAVDALHVPAGFPEESGIYGYSPRGVRAGGKRRQSFPYRLHDAPPGFLSVCGCVIRGGSAAFEDSLILEVFQSP